MFFDPTYLSYTMVMEWQLDRERKIGIHTSTQKARMNSGPEQKRQTNNPFKTEEREREGDSEKGIKHSDRK